MSSYALLSSRSGFDVRLLFSVLRLRLVRAYAAF
jgi:hypothetical protein